VITRASQDDLLTYEGAAEILGVQVNTIKQLVTRKILFSTREQGSTLKYLTRSQVEWYQRRRNGTAHEPNPYLVNQGAQSLSQAGATLTPEDIEAISGADMPQEFSGFALLFLVLMLLLAIIANKQPDKSKLEELRTAPQLQPMRRAILKLASEIAA
jgi:hypothetical protein